MITSEKQQLEIISMEEYLERRHEIREKESHHYDKMAEKSTALEMAVLSV